MRGRTCGTTSRVQRLSSKFICEEEELLKSWLIPNSVERAAHALDRTRLGSGERIDPHGQLNTLLTSPRAGGKESGLLHWGVSMPPQKNLADTD